MISPQLAEHLVCTLGGLINLLIEDGTVKEKELKKQIQALTEQRQKQMEEVAKKIVVAPANTVIKKP